MFRPRYLAVLLVVMSVAGAAIADDATEDRISYARQIRTLLADACFHCHGFDRQSRKAELRMDDLAEVLRDRGGYAAIVPGNPDESEAFQRMIDPIASERMPPPSHPHQLNDDQIQLIRKWIAQGAEYEGHWAFTPPVKAEL